MTILIVDSDRAALAATAAALRRWNPEAEIIPMEDGMSAVQYSLNHPVDAVLVDVLMPRISGFDVARLVRKFRPKAAAVIISETGAYLARARRDGLSGYYLKPLGTERSENLLTEEEPEQFFRPRRTAMF